MRDFPSSCFGESGVQVAASTTSSSSSAAAAARNSVTYLYQSRLLGLVEVAWTTSIAGGPSLSLAVDGGAAAVSLSLSSKRKGSRRLRLPSSPAARARLFWDLSAATFAAAPEPLAGFYAALVVGRETALLLGDLRGEACRRTGSPPPAPAPALLSKREHVAGGRAFSTRARFGGGASREISVECGGAAEAWLEVRVDGESAMRVERLRWGFRGNRSVLVGGAAVEVLWDAHDWLFGGPAGSVAVFMFRSSAAAAEDPWEEEEGLGFSLVLYAWRNE